MHAIEHTLNIKALVALPWPAGWQNMPIKASINANKKFQKPHFSQKMNLECILTIWSGFEA